MGATSAALVLAGPAHAQDGQSTVRLDGRAIFRVGESAEFSAEDRADRVETRLLAFLANLDALPPAVVRAEENEWLVTIAGIPVVSVLPSDAENNLTTGEALARRWAVALDVELARARDERLGLGGRFLAETRGAIQTAFASVAESAIRIVPRVLAAALVVGAFVLLAWAVNRLLRMILVRTVKDRTLENLIKQIAYYSIILLGIVIAAGALGFSPQALVTGLGLSGLVLGSALKDILSNFVSGLLILALRPFKLGDQIVVGDAEGAVERIELRATQIRMYDGRVALLPNADVFTSRIVNNTADPVRRGNVRVALAYDADLQRLLPVFRDAAQTVSGVLERPVTVRLDALGPDELELDVSFWTDSRRSDFKDTCSEVRQRLVATMAGAGILPEVPECRCCRESCMDNPVTNRR